MRGTGEEVGEASCGHSNITTQTVLHVSVSDHNACIKARVQAAHIAVFKQ